MRQATQHRQDFDGGVSSDGSDSKQGPETRQTEKKVHWAVTKGLWGKGKKKGGGHTAIRAMRNWHGNWRLAFVRLYALCLCACYHLCVIVICYCYYLFTLGKILD